MPEPSRETSQDINLDQLLLRAFVWMDESLQRNIQARGGPKVTHSQSMVILTIGEGVGRPSAIAERLGVSRQAIHQCLRELGRLNLVELIADPEDGRAKIARLSKAGLPTQKVAREVLAELEVELEKRIGKRALSHLRKALEQNWGEPALLEIKNFRREGKAAKSKETSNLRPNKKRATKKRATKKRTNKKRNENK